MIEAVKQEFDKSDPGFGTWAVPACPLRVDYSLALLEDVRREVLEGFQKLSRGGVEVGGVLYGTRTETTLRITAMRPIACEHARGPGFLLSDADRAAFTSLLESPAPEGLVCLGWFLSHTRTDINLSDTDLELYQEYFPAPWQIAMVIRPGRGGSMRAGFFFREREGSIRTDRSYEEFNFPDRLAGVIDHIGRPERRTGNDRRRAPRDGAAEESMAPAVAEEETPVAMFQTSQPPRTGSRRWLWLGVWGLALVALGIFALPYITGRADRKSASLSLLEKQGNLQIEWDGAANVIPAGAAGSLTIVDGKETAEVPLAARDLQSGHFSYQRKTGDIEVRLHVRLPDGGSIQEASRFLGRAPETTDMSASDARRTQLESELNRLRGENAAQQEKIQQLERTLRVLQNRLGIK